MGYYVPGPARGKVDFILEEHGGTLLYQAPKSLAEIPAGRGLVVVVDNGPFEAAAFCFSDAELKDFTAPGDLRAKTFLTMPLDVLKEVTGYHR